MLHADSNHMLRKPQQAPLLLQPLMMCHADGACQQQMGSVNVEMAADIRQRDECAGRGGGGEGRGKAVGREMKLTGGFWLRHSVFGTEQCVIQCK